ncbi:salicylate synthase [Streptomyces sp. YU58]|uniref:salicylate synthase n=1 Tax=Streptomyces sp. SX92 TaxID=3158972 RepID=UPI0027BAC71B|nr:salicylate synthase [Streptomyces coralus]WLW50144.1 salicylate synthase [Streptomyces coralus]
MTEQQRYHEVTVPVSGDPMLHAARLARRGPHEQYVVYERQGEWSYCAGAEAELRLLRDHVHFRTGADTTSVPCTSDPLGQVHRLLDDLPIPGWRAYGWAAFELSYALAGLPEEAVPSEAVLLHLVVPSVEVRLVSGEALIRCTDPAMVDKISRLLADPETGPVPAPPLAVDITGDARQPYQAAVSAAVSAIRAGELHKVILSRIVEVEQDIDLVDTYVTGRRANTPARSFLLNLNGLEAAGFSPETVVEVTADGAVATQPLAGTRALTGDAGRDEQLRAELLADAKEVYEHAVSVQMAWNELTQICAPGSVRVEELMQIKRRGSVQHLASRVTGRLEEPGQGPWPGLAAVFPAVTASGVPKKPAYEQIRRHEPEPRGPYSGAILMVGSGGELDAALVLRTVFRRGGRTWLRAGAGIVGESTPEREFEETCEKLRSVSRHLVPTAKP